MVDLSAVPWAWDITDAATGFVLGEQISGGSNGAVFAATLRGQPVAAKSHHAFLSPKMYGLLGDPDAFRHVVREVTREITTLAKLEQPEGQRQLFVGFRGVVYSRLTVANVKELQVPSYLLMELVQGPGTLADIIAELGATGRAPPSSFVLRLVAEVAEGLQAMHAQGFMHRYTKAPATAVIAPPPVSLAPSPTPASFLRTQGYQAGERAGGARLQAPHCRPRAGQARADGDDDTHAVRHTGLHGAGDHSHWQARRAPSLPRPSPVSCPPAHPRPPDALCPPPRYSDKVDVYALGLIAVELVLHGEAPSQAWGVREDQLRRAVALVPEVGALLRGCLEHEPAQRWTATAALEFAQGAAAAPPPPPFPAALPPAQARQDAISLGLQMEVETQRQRAELAELRAQEQSERATRA